MAENTSGTDQYVAFDFDQHFFEPAEIWTEYLPAKYRDIAPRHAPDSLGLMREVVGGETLPRIPRVPVPRIQPKHEQLATNVDSSNKYGLAEEIVRAGSEPEARLKFLDMEGVEGALIFPTAPLHFGAVENHEYQEVLCAAYNDWAQDYCKTDPDRLIAPAFIPQIDVAASLRETRRMLDKGVKGIAMRPNPVGRHLEDPAWEPLWDLLNEAQAFVAFHEGASLVVPQLGADRTDNYNFQHMMSHPFEQMLAMLTLIGGGILQRHPNMRAFFIEAGCGWVPYWLERMEHHFETPYENVQLELSPTEFFQRQCWVSAGAEEATVVASFVDSLGPGNVCWSTDFPHPDHEWIGLAKVFADRDDIEPDTKEQIMRGNARKALKLA